MAIHTPAIMKLRNRGLDDSVTKYISSLRQMDLELQHYLFGNIFPLVHDE